MKRVYFALAALAAIFAGCSKEVDTPEPVVSAEKAVTLKASIGDPATRVSSDNAGIFKWQSSDEITVVTDNDAIRQFTIIQNQISDDGTSATFDGTIPTDDEISYALYPASKKHKADGTFHLDKNIVWKANASNMPMRATVGGEETSFDALGGVLKLVLFNIPADADYLKFSATSKKITGEFTITNNVITTGAKSNSDSDNDNELVIDFSANYSANKVFYIPLPTAPENNEIDGFTVALYETLDATPLFSVTSTKLLVVEAEHLIIAKALNCAKETILWSEDFSSYDADDVPSGGNYSYSCTGSGTKVYDAVLAGGTTPELLIGKNSGTFTAGSISTNGAKTITLTYKTNAKALSVSSSTQGVTISPASNSSTSGEHTATVTNANEAGTISLTFTATSSDNVRLDDIKLGLPGKNISAPTITAEVDALNFAVGESSKSITVGLSDNTIDGLGLGALVSGTNKDKFTAAIEGTTLTVTAIAPNPTAANYTATVTLRASGAANKTIAVTQASCLVLNPTDLAAASSDAAATATWTKDANATSYVAYLCTNETETPAKDGVNVSENINITENDCTLELTGLTNGTTYHLYVKVNGVAEGYAAPTDDYANVSFTPKKLESISVDVTNAKTTYNLNEPFSFAGAVVTATYSDNTDAIVTSSCTTDYDDATFSTAGNVTVTVSYTEGAITKTATFVVTVAIVDVLTNTTTGISGTNYTNWNGKSKGTTNSGIHSDAVYSGNSAGGSNNSGTCIQLRSTNSSGIITTTSGGNVRKISVSWNSSTENGRTLNIYGKNSAYSEVSDLYNNTNQGTLLGTIVYGTSTELTVIGDYEYVGLRSSSNAMYLGEIRIQWEPAATKYNVTIDPGIANGSVSANVSRAKENDPVTLTATPASGYALSEWDVYKTGDSNTKVTVTGNSFNMPAYDVTVSATFEAVPTISVTNPINDVSATAGTYTIDGAYTLENGATRAKVSVSDPDGTVVSSVSKVDEDGKISITVNGNTGASRSGSFKIKYDDQASQTITVNQVAATYSVEVGSHTNGTVSFSPNSPVSVGTEVTLTADADTGYEFSAWDVHKKDDSSVKVSVTNNKFTMPAYPVTIEASFTESSSTTVTWELVTSVNNLSAGDEIIIADVDGEYALGPQATSNRTGKPITSSNDVLTEIDDDVVILTLEGSSDNWMFYVGSVDNQNNKLYLYASSGSANQLKQASSTTAGNNGKWTISITSAGVATINANGTNSRKYMRFNPNNNSPLFACYANNSTTGTLTSIYKKVTTGGSPGAGAPANPNISPVADKSWGTLQ